MNAIAWGQNPTVGGVSVSLLSIERDCIGVDAEGPWQLHGPVVTAASKALAKSRSLIAQAEAPKYAGNGMAAYTHKQSTAAAEVTAARIVLHQTFGPVQANAFPAVGAGTTAAWLPPTSRRAIVPGTRAAAWPASAVPAFPAAPGSIRVTSSNPGAASPVDAVVDQVMANLGR